MARNRNPNPANRSRGGTPRKGDPTTTGQLRIIAGQWRGRVLKFPALDGLRPTGDRVRETLFNWLQGDITQARCLDLFAGSGALGLEALSRGAQHCTFIDTQSNACQALAANLELLNCSQGQIAQTNALQWLASSANGLEKPYDIIFCDPPFAANLWPQTLAALSRHPCLASNALVYIEAPKDATLEPSPSWQLARVKDAGQIRFYLFQATG
ncbi:16S rRNA (guanine(966)-N(2))-methyltransferase RsmD [Halioxenophilus aromaticivorans]